MSPDAAHPLVWVCAVHDVVTAPNVLDAVELATWASFTSSPAADAYLALHCLTRQALAQVFGPPESSWTFDRTCPGCPRPHGRPLVTSRPDTWVSLSRTTTHVSVAVSSRGPVGIDIEHLGRFDDPAEAVGWTRKEAALKAIGVGLGVDPFSMPTPPRGSAVTVAAGHPSVVVEDLDLGALPLAGALAVTRSAAGPSRQRGQRAAEQPVPQDGIGTTPG